MTYITDALKPLVLERERHARMVDQLDRAIAAVEKLGREGRLTIVPTPPEEPPVKYWCAREGCGQGFDTGQKLGAHAGVHKAEDRRKERDAEDSARAAENAKKRADEADRRTVGGYTSGAPVRLEDIPQPFKGPAPGTPVYIPPEFDPPTVVDDPQTAGPPAHGGDAKGFYSQMVRTGLPRKPVDHDRVRNAAFDAIDDEVKGD